MFYKKICSDLQQRQRRYWSLKKTGKIYKPKFVSTYISGQSIWNKAKKSSKIVQDQKTLVSVFRYFLTTNDQSFISLNLSPQNFEWFANFWGESFTMLFILDINYCCIFDESKLYWSVVKLQNIMCKIGLFLKGFEKEPGVQDFGWKITGHNSLTETCETRIILDPVFFDQD